MVSLGSTLVIIMMPMIMIIMMLMMPLMIIIKIIIMIIMMIIMIIKYNISSLTMSSSQLEQHIKIMMIVMPMSMIMMKR